MQVDDNKVNTDLIEDGSKMIAPNERVQAAVNVIMTNCKTEGKDKKLHIHAIILFSS